MLFNIWVPKKWGKISFLFMHIKITLYFQLLKKCLLFFCLFFSALSSGFCSVCVCVCVCVYLIREKLPPNFIHSVETITF